MTLDPDVVRLMDEAVHRERRSIKQVINDALRRGLAPSPISPPEPYELAPHESSLQPGLDLSGFNRLADQLEDEAILATSRTGQVRTPS